MKSAVLWRQCPKQHSGAGTLSGGRTAPPRPPPAHHRQQHGTHWGRRRAAVPERAAGGGGGYVVSPRGGEDLWGLDGGERGAPCGTPECCLAERRRAGRPLRCVQPRGSEAVSPR